jgi:hypothetical protein
MNLKLHPPLADYNILPISYIRIADSKFSNVNGLFSIQKVSKVEA